jgi:hypothetical protein
MADGCWRAVAFGPRSFGIERGKDRMLIGSIDLIDGRWRVDIMGPDGDTGEFADYDAALEFMRTVEARSKP